MSPSQSKAVFGIAAFDIVEDGARMKVWNDLRGRVIRATKSVMIFDWTFVDQVKAVLSKYAKGKRDEIYPPQRFNEEDADKTRHWVRLAMDRFFDEVIHDPRFGFKAIVDRAEKELKDEEIGVLDLMGRVEDAAKRIEKRVEDFHIAIATFRLDGDFNEFKDAMDAKMEVEQQRAALIVAKNAAKLKEEVEKKAADKKAAKTA